jgi:hypothetical protein
MGKKSGAKRSKREIATSVAVKRQLLKLEHKQGMRTFMKMLDHQQLNRAGNVKAAGGELEAARTWAPHVYLPSSVIQALLSTEIQAMTAAAEHGASLHWGAWDNAFREVAVEADEIAALLSWRVGQGIYHFDDALLAELAGTDLSGDLPVEVLKRLPEWCVYVDMTVEDEPAADRWYMDGFLAYCDHQGLPNGEVADAAQDSLVLMPLLMVPNDDGEGRSEELLKIVIPLLAGKTFNQCVEAGLGSWVLEAEMEGNPLVRIIPELARRMLVMVLYLCSDEPDLSGLYGKPVVRKRPSSSLSQRLGPGGEVKKWDVGLRVGAALRKARSLHEENGHESGQTGGGSRMRPHMRRAHFHGYWYGPRSSAQRLYKYKWLSPMLINVTDSDDVVPTVHEVLDT